MKKITTLLLLVFFGAKNYAQDCQLSFVKETLSGNNIRASIPANGNLFYTYDSDNIFQLTTDPNPPYPSTFFAGGIWIGAKDDTGSLKLAGATYTSPSTNDFVSGPIHNDNGQLFFDCENYDRLWKVLGFEIMEHLSDFSDNNIIDNPIANIYAYPGHQNPHFENIHGFALPNTPQGLAPFFDENSDGIYNPDDGDYPLPEAVNPGQIPSQIIWGIFNDAGTAHTASGGDPLNIEIQQTAWSFYCDDNDLLNNSIFTSHKIINRGNETLNSLIVSKWMDFDLGCYTDDYLGCIPDMNTFYGYNEDPIDGTVDAICEGGIPTFGNNPPVQAVTFLNKNMTAFSTTNNGGISGVPATVNPTQPQEYYNYMQGLWRDGTPFTVGGFGYLSSTDTTKFLFPDNPNDPAGWNMVTANLPFGDRRTISSSEISGSFAPGDVVNVDMAYTFYQDENLNQIESVNMVYDNTPLIQQMYNDGFASACNSNSICLDDCVYTGDADKDSVVTACDFLQIGLGFGETGFERNKPKVWFPHEGQDWSNDINGINLKHTDCSGNAIIDSTDFSFAEENFGLSYKKSPIVDIYNYGSELSITSNSSSSSQIDTIPAGGLGTAKINLNVAEEIYGIAFTVEIDPDFLSIIAPIFYSPWVSGTSNRYDFKLNEEDKGELHYAYVKLDGENSLTDEGRIIQFFLKAKESNYELVETVVRIKNIKAVLNDGTFLDYGAQDFVVSVENPDGSGIILNNDNLAENNIQIFPNPTSDFLNIKTDELPTHLSIFDIYGKNVLEKRSDFENEMQLSIDHFSAGVYFVKIKADGKDFVKKIIKF